MMVKFSLYPYSSILVKKPPIDCLGSNPICWLRYICILCVYIYIHRAEADGSAEGN